MTTLNFNSAETVPASNFQAEEQADARKEKWIRYYCPALAIMGSIVYVIHSWMAVA
jgi:hypothetical protein